MSAPIAASSGQARHELLRWVAANAHLPGEELDERSPLLGEASVVDSLALVSLTFLIEDLRGAPIPPDDYTDLVRFSTVENIVQAYFGSD